MNRVRLFAIVAICMLTSIAGTKANATEEALVKEVRVTLLSTMVAEFWGVGEWGFSALVEFDGQRLLFDTGARPQTVLHNAQELGLSLDDVDNVFLSHNHWDHAGGLVSLRRSVMQQRQAALARVHAGQGIFAQRILDQDALAKLPPIPRQYLVNILEVRDEYTKLGGQFVVHDAPHELSPGVWITGPIPRLHPEKNWTPFMKIRQGDALIEDTIPEDQALVIHTTKGLVIVAGCGHAGIINTIDYARQITGGESVHAVIGGFHMLSLSEDKVAWTGEQMREAGVQYVIGAHCTGLNAVHGIRNAVDLDRASAVVGTVGSVFTLDAGIQPGFLNR